jgi:hypothetical protein
LGREGSWKNPWAGEEDVFLVHPQNSLVGLILSWCTGGCWFIPAQFLYKKFCDALWVPVGLNTHLAIMGKTVNMTTGFFKNKMPSSTGITLFENLLTYYTIYGYLQLH